MSKAPSADDAPPTSFEQRLETLERLVDELESGELELADSLDRFKQGVALSKQCQDMLSDAQQTI
ncbi:MAG: exodeoxyribonuclease VII small subunit, partial [Pseudomonadota bacterium]